MDSAGYGVRNSKLRKKIKVRLPALVFPQIPVFGSTVPLFAGLSGQAAPDFLPAAVTDKLPSKTNIDFGVFSMRQNKSDRLGHAWPSAIIESHNATWRQHLVYIPPVDKGVIESVPTINV